MIVQLDLDELDLVVDALEMFHDQALETKHDLPEEEVAEHVVFIEAVAALSAKFAKLV